MLAPRSQPLSSRVHSSQLTRYLPSHVPVLLVYLLVLGLVRGAYVPIEAILQAQLVRIVVDLFKLGSLACEGTICLDEVCF